MGHWWQRNIIEPGKLPLLLSLAAFVLTFVITRTITRMIRAGVGPFKDHVSSGGLHVHHAVPGIIGLIIGAFMALGTESRSPWHGVAAVLVGAGTSLVLDEFALILRLEDVYWSSEGRVSVEMISLAFGCLGCTLVGLAPFGVDEMGSQELEVRSGAIATTLVTLALVIVCVTKGKFKMALFGTFLPVLAWVGAVRLARPRSRWAKRYGTARLAEAERRTARFDTRWDPFLERISDIIAGKPSTPGP
ncbi:MAG: hypothetical protein ABIR68_02480 [Ilumatobacteraceae bacterium]